MRTVEINLEDKIVAKSGVREAIGRLVCWALEGYDHVTINKDGPECLIAYYSDSKHPYRKYTIGAVHRGDGEFTFHS